jgi:flagellar protein FlaG
MVAEIGNQALNAVANTRQNRPEQQGSMQEKPTGKTLPVEQTNLPQGDSAPKINTQDLEKVTAALNKFMQSRQRSLQFSQDEESGRIVVKVINKETNEVVRQFPPDELLSLSRAIRVTQEEGADPDSGFLLEELG